MLWEPLGDQNAISWPAGAREAGGRKKLIFCERARNSCVHPPFRCRVVNLERSNTIKTHPVHALPALNEPPGPLQDKPVWGINIFMV